MSSNIVTVEFGIKVVVVGLNFVKFACLRGFVVFGRKDLSC